MSKHTVSKLVSQLIHEEDHERPTKSQDGSSDSQSAGDISNESVEVRTCSLSASDLLEKAAEAWTDGYTMVVDVGDPDVLYYVIPNRKFMSNIKKKLGRSLKSGRVTFPEIKQQG